MREVGVEQACSLVYTLDRMPIVVLVVFALVAWCEVERALSYP